MTPRWPSQRPSAPGTAGWSPRNAMALRTAVRPARAPPTRSPRNQSSKSATRIPTGATTKVAGALANLGYDVSDQTVGNVLKRHGISPAPKRKGGIGWKEFIKAQAAVTAACDFFTVEVLTLRGLLTYYVLFFIHLDESRRVQVAWNVTMEGIGFLNGYKKLLQDRDPKFCPEFRRLIESHGIDNVRLPARSPNLNAVAERWVRTVESECLSKLILLGESSLRRALDEFVAHYHAERNHQEKDNKLLFRSEEHTSEL